MRACGWKLRAAQVLTALYCALVASAAARAQSEANPLRSTPRSVPVPVRTKAPPPAPDPVRAAAPARSAAALARSAAAPRRFTEYDIWGDETAANAPSSRLAPVVLEPSYNPLRQAQYNEDQPRPAKTL